MTHFSVLAISPTADEVTNALAPFELRFLNDGKPGDYLVFEDQTVQERRRHETGAETCFRDHNGGVYQFCDDRFEHNTWLDDPIPSGYENDEIPLRDLYATFEAYASATGLESDGNGCCGLWSNPNVRWDYWQTGYSDTYSDENDDNAYLLQGRIKDVDPDSALKGWCWNFHAVITAEGQWVERCDETDEIWQARCMAFIRGAPSDYWFTAVMCHF